MSGAEAIERTGEPERTPSAAEATERPRRPRRRRWLAALGFLLVLGVLGGVAALLQTQAGQRLVLESALERVRGSLAGSLEVGDVRSGTLLTGATLLEVSLTDADGHSVLRADSVVVRYLPTGLVGGAPRLRSLVLWGADVVVARYREDGPLNLERVIAEGPTHGHEASEDEQLAGGGTFLSTHVGFRDATVSVLLPAEEGDEGAPAGEGLIAGPHGPLRRIAFEELSLDLEDVALRLGSGELVTADLAGMSTRARLPLPGDEPLVVREAFGRLRFGEEGLRVEEGLFRLPGTLVEGSLGLGPVADTDGWGLHADLRAPDWSDLSDLRWLDPRVPEGTFRGAARVRAQEEVEVTLSDARLRLPASDVVLDGEVSIDRDGGLRADGLAVAMSPLVLARLEPWLERDLPLDGWLSGRLTLSGGVDDLAVDGRVTLVPAGYGGEPTTADLNGRVHLGARPGWTGFSARLDPLNWRLARAFVPDLPVEGRGTASLELEGRLDGRVGLVVELGHLPDGGEPSQLFARGSVARTSEGGWTVDLAADLAALWLGALAPFAPELGLRGSVRGPVPVRGPLEELAFTAELDTDGGAVELDGAVDVLDPAARYRLRADAGGLVLSALSERLPQPTEWSGSVEVEGTGLSLDSLAGTASVEVFASRVGGVAVDSLAGVVHATDGMLVADTLRAFASGARVEGSGSVGLRPDREGEARIAFAADSLGWLRPSLMGDSLLVRDQLSTLELELLRLEGIDPDTLPTSEDVRLAGAVTGSAELTGSIRSLALALDATLVGGAWRQDEVDSLHLSVRGSGLPTERDRWEVDAEARGLSWAGRSFGRASFSGSMLGRAGEGAVRLERGDVEEYELAGAFALDSLGGSADLLDARARIEDQTWFLSRPAGVRWTPSSLFVDSMEIRREGEDPMRLVASGTIRRGGSSDFQLEAEGLHLDRIGIVTQSDLDLAGHADLALRIEGPAEAPVVSADLDIEDPRFRTMSLSHLAASLDYADLRARVQVQAWDGDRVALIGEGVIPVDLALAEVERRWVDRPMQAVVRADSLAAAVALAYFESIQNVEGTISADIEIGGTPLDPTPSGSVRLENASWTVEGLGVRHREVSGQLSLSPDQSVEVQLAALGEGRSEVRGTVALSPISDPALDLDISFQGFRALQRRDMEGVITGSVHLGGTYRRPLVEGAVSVDAGTLFVEEFSRSASVVDLADPRLFGEGLAVDTTVFVAQPILADVRNPFLDNLRLDVDLAVPRNVWLRSNQMNVEMGGELLVRYDRTEGDLVLVGELQALRGTYLVFNRSFDVETGTISFIGTPGVNPGLAISARTQVRTAEETIEVIATMEGTLLQPRVTLTSEDGALSQSDLISYLVFNRPAGDLGLQQQTMLGDLTTGAGGVVVGAFASQLGSTIAQNLGFDYLSLSSAGATDYSTAQVELGRYITDDVFVVFVVRPLSTPEVSRVGGVRVEWALTDAYNVEAYREDRFLRGGSGVFGVPEFGGQQIYGIMLFREWGFNE